MEGGLRDRCGPRPVEQAAVPDDGPPLRLFHPDSP
jgi:hypothetical protein